MDGGNSRKQTEEIDNSRGFAPGKDFDIWTLGNDEIGSFGQRKPLPSDGQQHSFLSSTQLYPPTIQGLGQQSISSPSSSVYANYSFIDQGARQLYTPGTARELATHASNTPYDAHLPTPNRHINHTTLKNNSTLYNSRSVASYSFLNLVDLLTDNVIVHPFVSLRRVCQVNRKCSPLVCVQPFTLVPLLYHLQQRQGMAPLFKGLSSELSVKALILGSETVIAEQTKWPSEFKSKNFIDNCFKHLSLKTLSILVATPFLCASAIETVQSAIVVKDRPAFIECFKEGILRLLHVGYTPSNRLLPIWILVAPTVMYHISHLIINNLARKFINGLKLIIGFRPRHSHMSMYDSSEFILDNDNTRQIDDRCADIDHECSQISTNIAACLFTDIALFPLETIMHSMYMQGTRTIVDNCDETTVVLPIITNYDGLTDCYQSIVKQEGTLGLYKGLGALFLQFGVRYVIIRTAHYIMRRVMYSRNKTDGGGGINTRISSTPNVMPKFVPAK